MFQNIKAILADDNGQGLAEYGLILALVSVVSIAALTAMGKQIGPIFDKVTADL
jgi:pilus assembly protein Flp/PilA